MKKLIAISAVALALTTCGSAATGTPRTSAVVHTSVVVKDSTAPGGHLSIAGMRYAAQQRLNSQLRTNAKKVNIVVSQLKGYVGKTWYVFSGATPRGWDCSGLVLWTYEQLGYNLEHRASKQKDAGTKVTEPKVGDIVAFTYKGSKSAYHVGIYVGNGKMVHAPKHGHVTRLESVNKFAGNYSKVTYTRIIDTI